MAKKKKKKFGWKAQMLMIGIGGMFIMFRSVSIVMVIGMIPTIVSSIVDTSKGHVKTLTVGAMNFAGCAPFLLEIWKRGATFDMAMTYILQPRTIMVMYFAAAMGYLIDWAVTGMASSLMVQRAKSRMKEIQDHEKLLIERWGPEVSNTIPLDEFGFPHKKSDENHH